MSQKIGEKKKKVVNFGITLASLVFKILFNWIARYWGLCFFLLFGYKPMDNLLWSLDTDSICEIFLVHSCHWRNI